MNIEKLLKQIEIERDSFKDLHVIRFFSSFVAVSKGKVIKVTDPYLEYCPLAGSLYDEIKKIKKFDFKLMKKAITKAVEEKISKFGFFTEKRELYRKDIAIPYGASEMMMYAISKKIIDAAVIVCDGAGTVITNIPEIVQGISARMNGHFLTSPINKVIETLREKHCYVVSPKTTDINQIQGLERAAKLGYKNVAVTINGYMGEDLSMVKEIEAKHNITITSLVVCTTGVSEERIQEIVEYADIVWSCASEGIRKIIGKKSILQLSKAIPVFVLTKKGLNLVAGYCSDEQLIRNLDSGKQYLISGKYGNTKIGMGNFDTYLSEAKLPMRSNKEPRLLTR